MSEFISKFGNRVKPVVKDALQAVFLISSVSLLIGCGGSNSDSGPGPDDGPALDPLALVHTSTNTTTSELGDTAELSLVLDHQPEASISFSVQSSNTSEATVSISEVTFTPDNWDNEQAIAVTGINDLIADGDQAYTVNIDLVTAANDLADSDRERLKDYVQTQIDFTNLDIVPLDLVYTVSGSTTSESGTAATLTLALNHQPEGNIKFAIQSTNINEAIVDLSEIEFTAENWATEQVVTVSGTNDFIVDGDQAFNITVKLAGELTDLSETDQKRFQAYVEKSEELTNTDIGLPIAGKISGLGGDAQYLETKGAFTYVAKGAKGLEIYYSLDPANMYLVGRYETLGNAHGLYVSKNENIVYVADDKAGFFIIDVSNPSAPSLIGSIPITDFSNDTWGMDVSVSTDGSRAIVGGDSMALKILDLSDPTQPQLQGNF